MLNSTKDIPEESRVGGGEDTRTVGHADPPGPGDDLPAVGDLSGAQGSFK